MKFTRSTWITLAVILLIVGAALLAVFYTRATSERNLAKDDLAAARLQLAALNKSTSDLNAQLVQVNADIAQWQSKIALLNSELAQAKVSLTQTQANFPTSVQTIEYDEILAGFAKAANLTVARCSATEPSTSDLGAGVTFYATTFTIEVNGKISDILNYIDKVVKSDSFKTASMSPVSFTVPQPLTQAQKDRMRADIKASLVAQADASLTAEQRMGIIEQAILQLLQEDSQGPTVAEMTQQIKDIITVEFGESIADSLASDIALAIEQNEADSLIGIVADIYGNYIGKLIAEGNSDLIAQLLGTFGEEIITELGNSVSSALPGQVVTIITSKLEALVAQQIEALVTDDSVNSLLAAAVTSAEMPSAKVTLTVYSYKGG